jgi:hypothetical protein
VHEMSGRETAAEARATGIQPLLGAPHTVCLQVVVYQDSFNDL